MFNIRPLKHITPCLEAVRNTLGNTTDKYDIVDIPNEIYSIVRLESIMVLSQN